MRPPGRQLAPCGSIRVVEVSLYKSLLEFVPTSLTLKSLTQVTSGRFFACAIISRDRRPLSALEPEPCLLANEAAMVALLDLEADLLRHIARRGGASVLCAMAQTSQQLRAPIIAAGDEMWREFALASRTSGVSPSLLEL